MDAALSRSRNRTTIKERDLEDATRAKEQARQKVETVLLKGLARDLGSDSLCQGWTVTFDIVKVTGDPEGLLRGPPINARHKSIKYWVREQPEKNFEPLV